MKVVWTGQESAGKTLRLAMEVDDKLARNAKWFKQSGIARPIAPNFKLAPGVEAHAEKLGIPILYWRHLHELVLIDQADVFIDELANYFDSRLWADLSLDVRQWLSQGAKSGIEMYATSQDFGMVDKSFRRLVNELYYVVKAVGSPRPAATRPPVKKIWGWCWVITLDPLTYDEKDDKFERVHLFDMKGFFIRRRYCEMFDTTQKIKRSEPAPLRHEVRFCEHYHEKGSECKHFRVSHL